MQYPYIVYCPDGSVNLLAVQWTSYPGYKELQAVLSPYFDDLEHVTVWTGEDTDFIGPQGRKVPGYNDMFVDQHGQMKELPVNKTATAIYRANAIVHCKAKADELPCIYGVAVLFKNQVWGDREVR